MSTAGFRGCFIFKGPLWSEDWVLLLYTNIYFEAFVKSFEVLLIFFSECWIKSNTYDSKVERNPCFPTLVWVTLVCSSGLPSLGWGQGLPLSAAHHLHLITHFFFDINFLPGWVFHLRKSLTLENFCFGSEISQKHVIGWVLTNIFLIRTIFPNTL